MIILFTMQLHFVVCPSYILIAQLLKGGWLLLAHSFTRITFAVWFVSASHLSANS